LNYKLITSISTLLLTLSFTACGGGSDSAPADSTVIDVIADNETPNIDNTPAIINTNPNTSENDDTEIPSKYYGTWSFVHSGEKIDIISTTVLDITEVADDENLLKVNADDTTYFLIRSSIARTKVTGKIEVQTNSNTSLAPNRASGFSGIGSINIILANVLDARIKEETVTESDGSFITTTLPSGTYNLTATDANNNLNAIVQIKSEENDIGAYKLMGDDINNFKAELIINDGYVVSDGATHEAILKI